MGLLILSLHPRQSASSRITYNA